MVDETQHIQFNDQRKESAELKCEIQDKNSHASDDRQNSTEV